MYIFLFATPSFFSFVFFFPSLAYTEMTDNGDKDKDKFFRVIVATRRSTPLEKNLTPSVEDYQIFISDTDYQLYTSVPPGPQNESKRHNIIACANWCYRLPGGREVPGRPYWIIGKEEDLIEAYRIRLLQQLNSHKDPYHVVKRWETNLFYHSITDTRTVTPHGLLPVLVPEVPPDYQLEIIRRVCRSLALDDSPTRTFNELFAQLYAWVQESPFTKNLKMSMFKSLYPPDPEPPSKGSTKSKAISMKAETT